MAITVRKIITDISDIFEIDEYGNITFKEISPIFEDDINGDLMPTIEGRFDAFFEININNNITPQI